jgi:hypothetical protein
MADKNVDPFEGKNIWKHIYLESLQMLHDHDVINSLTLGITQRRK